MGAQEAAGAARLGPGRGSSSQQVHALLQKGCHQPGQLRVSSQSWAGLVGAGCLAEQVQGLEGCRAQLRSLPSTARVWQAGEQGCSAAQGGQGLPQAAEGHCCGGVGEGEGQGWDGCQAPCLTRFWAAQAVSWSDEWAPEAEKMRGMLCSLLGSPVQFAAKQS